MKKYKGLSDFFLNASYEDKLKVFTEVARKASEDQRKLLEEFEEQKAKETSSDASKP